MPKERTPLSSIDMQDSVSAKPLLPVFDSEVLRETLDGLSRFILATSSFDRKDRLWPADSMVFQTNPLSLAHGASGIAYFLHRWLGELPTKVKAWMLDCEISLDSYPPGLYSGLAGIAWSFAEIGIDGRAEELMKLLPHSPLAFEVPGIHDGVAGWGLAALAFHQRTSEDSYLALACRAADHLVLNAQRNRDGLFWQTHEEEFTRLGFGYGASGIAFFLLQAWRATSEDIYLRTACEALAFEVSNGKKEADGSLVWGVHIGDEGHRPYWLRGGGGVASALIRFYDVLREDHYLQAAEKAARGSMAFFSAAPHLFEGLASMGDTLLDMYQITGESFYLEKARQKAMQTLLYRIDGPDGFAFPGRFNLRISHDMAVGGAGVGLFLMRALSPGPRCFQDPVFGASDSNPSDSIPFEGSRKG